MINGAVVAGLVAYAVHVFGLAADGVLACAVGLPIRRAIIAKYRIPG